MINEKRLEIFKKTKCSCLNNQRGKTKPKKHRNVLIVNGKGTLKSSIGQKEVEQRVKDQSNVKRKIPKKKKVKEKVHIVEESGSSSGDDNDVAFMNSEIAFISKNGSEITHILDTGANAHMTPYKNLLKDY
jgi:hypothetical protein